MAGTASPMNSEPQSERSYSKDSLGMSIGVDVKL